ncbi:MAG: response regulator transcription factor [bacterium]
MFSLLIVDDEMIAVQGIKQGIDWDDLNVDSIYEAFDAEEALEVINNHQIDLVICDIEMPGMDGLELLNEINRESPETLTILLTGHAKFNYAQKALKHGCFDYLLKPIEHEKIEETVVTALEALRENREQREFMQIYNKFSELWKKQNPILIERFWQDIFSQRIINYSQLSSVMELYSIPLDIDDRVIPVLLSIEIWQVPLSEKDEEILKYGLRNMATEILEKRTSGVVFQNHDGNVIMIIYPDKNENKFISDEEIEEICREIIKIADDYLHCTLSCYINDPTPINELEKGYFHLLELERNNIKETNTIVHQSSYTISKDIYPQTAPFDSWQLLFELGRKESLINEIDEYFNINNEEMMNSEVLESFYFGFLNMIYSALHKKDISIQAVYNINYLHELSSTRSYYLLREKITELINDGVDYLNDHLENNPVIIRKIHDYIKANYKDKITRKDIASHVYLNPAYLSRLFKKETGMTLTEYVTELRIAEARRLLIETDYTITAIAEEIGYYNYSYFSKIFREIVGVTAGDYRKNYQQLQ